MASDLQQSAPLSKSSSPPTSPAPPSSPSGQKGSVPQVLYRRPLPTSCIAFASDEGKAIFKEALGTGHMNCYFKIASQFRTQDEPAYCGLATLVMVLNALEIDPGRVWKGLWKWYHEDMLECCRPVYPYGFTVVSMKIGPQLRCYDHTGSNYGEKTNKQNQPLKLSATIIKESPWKWYHEDMLECCVPTQIIRQEGVTFDEFICLADCNYLDTEAVRADSSCSEDTFRDLVKAMTLKDDAFLVVSYSRQTLSQTGDGHFAPVSGYHPDRDLVLILDTARFKYPPHWVPLSLLFEATKKLDKVTGLPRGYIQLWPARDTKCLLLFKTSEQFSVSARPEGREHYEGFVAAWNQQLRASLSSPGAAPFSVVVRLILQGLVEVSRELDQSAELLRTQEHVSCTQSCTMQCVVQQLLAELRATEMFRAFCDHVLTLPDQDLALLDKLFGAWPSVVVQAQRQGVEVEVEEGKVCGDTLPDLCLCDFLTAFCLCWPYALPSSPSSLGSFLEMWATDTLHGSQGQLLRNEMITLHRQLRNLTGFHPACGQNTPSAACAQRPEACCHKVKPATRTTCCSGKHK